MHVISGVLTNRGTRSTQTSNTRNGILHGNTDNRFLNGLTSALSNPSSVKPGNLDNLENTPVKGLPERRRASPERRRAVQISLKDLEQANKRAKVILPGSKFRQRWDIWMGILILWSVWAGPWKVAFVSDESLWSKALDYGMDIFFLIDIILNFRTGYYGLDGILVFSFGPIATRYLKSWFMVDFLSTVPIDLIVNYLIDTENASSLKSFKLARTFRLFRLLKLVRLLKLQKILNFFRTDGEGVAPVVLHVCGLTFKMLFVSHLLACGFYFVGTSTGEPSFQ